MADLKLDINGDLDLSTGDLVILSGVDATAQRLSRKLKFFLGEWFLDTRLGIPYFGSILVKNPSTNVIISLYRQVITSDEAVTILNDLDLEYDAANRTLSVSFTAETVEGPLEFETEFIIS